MRKLTITIAILGLCAFGAAGIAGAHECDYSESSGRNYERGEQSNCDETDVQPNWRDGNYVPLFDLADRDDPDQRKAAQRWRDCSYWDEQGRYHNNQFCVWLDFGTSASGSPNEVHAGTGGQHCFLFEAAHDCSDHDRRRGEGVHDAHGGAVYVDVCLARSDETPYCDEGMADTQAGVTVMDHNPCGAIVVVVACTDEYHVMRPFDDGYTQEQMDDSAVYIARIVDEPMVYLCGKPGYPSYGFPPCGGGGGGSTPASPLVVDGATAASLARADAAMRAARGDDAAGALSLGTTRTLASERAASPAPVAGAPWFALAFALGAFAIRVRRAAITR